MKQKLIVGGVALALMLGGAGVASADVPASCAEAQAAGRTNIPRGDAAYVPALDRDNDGVACDEKDRDAAVPAAAPVVGDATADDTDLDGAGPTEGTADDEAEGDGEHEGPWHQHKDGSWGPEGDWENDDQVSVVPEGGAPTGDGSTEDATGWWIGGGLLAALAAAGVTFRRRLAGLAGR